MRLRTRQARPPEELHWLIESTEDTCGREDDSTLQAHMHVFLDQAMYNKVHA